MARGAIAEKLRAALHSARGRLCMGGGCYHHRAKNYRKSSQFILHFKRIAVVSGPALIGPLSLPGRDEDALFAPPASDMRRQSAGIANYGADRRQAILTPAQSAGSRNLREARWEGAVRAGSACSPIRPAPTKLNQRAQLPALVNSQIGKCAGAGRRAAAASIFGRRLLLLHGHAMLTRRLAWLHIHRAHIATDHCGPCHGHRRNANRQGERQHKNNKFVRVRAHRKSI
jgi:hypothetical protein